jgi:hypothetical protein
VRRNERMAVEGTARLRPNSWSSLEVRLIDLSAEGFRIQCEVMILAGSAIWIDLPGVGEVEAQVSWRRRGELGARFILPIDLSSCAIPAISDEAVLARLLVQRADARRTGQFRHELQLREKIAETLPMRRIDP